VSAWAWFVVVVACLGALDLALASPALARRAPGLVRDRSGNLRSPLAVVLVGLVRLYRAGWSVRSAGVCRFEPSCSAYAWEAVRRHGGVGGGLLALRRLLRCQPLSRGGYDPVPVRMLPVKIAVVEGGGSRATRRRRRRDALPRHGAKA
jgi:putative membrane protein insertion efficiency factor